VVHQVRRMEQSAETIVQMHSSVQSNRTNDIMRTLTGFFGMNFEFMPIIHSFTGFWWTLACMVF
jgi:magnesium transporter